jgi:hypothetical protein
MEFTLLDISDIDCNNLNIDELQKILTPNEITTVTNTCSLNPISPAITSSITDPSSILDQMNELLNTEQPVPSVPSTPSVPLVQPVQPVQPIIKPVQPITPAIDIIEGPKLLTAPLTTVIKRAPQTTSLKNFAASFAGGSNLLGGSSLIGINISIDKITKLLNITTQLDIMTYYYNNQTEIINNESIPKVLNMDELILIDAALKYYDFIEKKYESIFNVINPESINSIPQEYRYNFYDIIMRDKHISQDDIDQFNKKVNNIKNFMYNLKMRKQENLTLEPLDKYTINVSKSSQMGGKNQQKATIVEEEINDKIRRLSDYLKKQKKHQQKGGDSSPEIDAIKNEIDIKKDKLNEPNLSSDIKKERTKQLIQYANQLVNTLITLKMVTKQIVDNDFGIAIFNLEIAEGKTNITNLKEIVDFVNEYASVLNFKNRNRDTNTFAETFTVNKLGSVRPTYLANKLQKYFENKYIKLQNKKIEPSKLIIVSTDDPQYPQYYSHPQIDFTAHPSKQEALDLIKLFKILLNVQSGGEQPQYVLLNKPNPDSSQLIESCFTSRQYNKFLRMMTDYLKAHNQDIEKPEFDKMKKDMETLQNIEKKLVDLYTIFNNYKKINDVYPQQIQKPVTVNHIKAVITDNNILIDQYGQINNNIIDLVKTIEKYLLLTENIADVNQNPNLKMELDNLLSTKTQSGGANLQQQVKKFSPFQEQEYFTTDTFKKIIQKMEEY